MEVNSSLLREGLRIKYVKISAIRIKQEKIELYWLKITFI